MIDLIHKCKIFTTQIITHVPKYIPHLKNRRCRVTLLRLVFLSKIRPSLECSHKRSSSTTNPQLVFFGQYYTFSQGEVPTIFQGYDIYWIGQIINLD